MCTNCKKFFYCVEIFTSILILRRKLFRSSAPGVQLEKFSARLRNIFSIFLEISRNFRRIYSPSLASVYQFFNHSAIGADKFHILLYQTDSAVSANMICHLTYHFASAHLIRGIRDICFSPSSQIYCRSEFHLTSLHFFQLQICIKGLLLRINTFRFMLANENNY